MNAMRPQTFDEIIGNELIVTQLRKQFEQGRVPMFYIIHGTIGTGKTTLARIISNKLNKQVIEINGADKDEVYDLRGLIDVSDSSVIVDEAHLLSSKAQNVLLKLTEDSKSIHYILCTTDIDRIKPALRRRAFVLTTKGITNDQIMLLLELAKDAYESNTELSNLYSALIKYEINSPALVIQAAEKYFNGTEADECVFHSYGPVDVKKLCSLIIQGKYGESVPLLKDIHKEDIVMIRESLIHSLRSVLLSNTDSVNAAKSIIILNEVTNDVNVFIAKICLVCIILKSIINERD